MSSVPNASRCTLSRKISASTTYIPNKTYPVFGMYERGGATNWAKKESNVLDETVKRFFNCPNE